MNSLTSALARFCASLVILAVCVYCAAAQVNRATVTGTVTDSTGSVIAGVDVAARNTETNAETTAITNADGIYVLPNLPPGTYALSFRKTGFKEIIQPSVTLISTQVAGINVSMPVGATSENVVVTAEAPVLDSESVSIGTNMNGKVVTDLPLSIYSGGRFVENFAVALTPGYSPISNPFTAVVNGNQYYTKDYTVDGTSATSSIRGDSMETGPSMESVEELQAQTSGLDAASAITNGGVMSFTLKSGTNQFHGSAFGYGHNEFLDANSWTNGAMGDPKAKARAWDYGGSVGGPVLKNKLFFFGTFERFTQDDFSLGVQNAFVPTSDMLNGNFSALLQGPITDSSGNPVINPCTGEPALLGQIFDPTTKQTVSGQTCWLPFPNNTIDPARFSAVAKKIIPLFQKYYPPDQPGLTSNDRSPKSNSPAQTPNQAVVKLDYNLTGSDKLSGSWIYNHRPRTLNDFTTVWSEGSTDGGPLTGARLQLVKSDEFRLSESHTFTPNLLNVLNLTYNWYWNGSLPTSSGTDWNSELGFGTTGLDNFPSINFGGAINTFGVTNIGNGSQGFQTGAGMITGDTVTWIRGRHSFSFGGDFRAYQVNSHTGTGALSFNFVPNTTDGGYTSQAGFGFASFLLGDVQNANQSVGTDLYGRRKSMSLFAQDSYKINPRLTLTAGLRWQYVFQYHEKYGHWANFDLQAIDPTLQIPGTLVFAKNGDDSFEKKEYFNNFSPQIGFAYNPWNRFVVRGSFGLISLPPPAPFYNGVPNGFAPGFQGTNVVNNPFSWDSGYPGVTVPGSTNVDPTTQYYLTYTDPHSLLPAFSTTFNIGIQYELTNNVRLEVAYVGNRGHHLPDTALAYNQPSAQKFLQVVNANPGLVPYGDFSSWQSCAKKGDPTAYVGITCPYDNFSGPMLSAIAPYPQLANWSTAIWFGSAAEPAYVGLPIGQTFYNSMVVDLVKRSGRGLSMDLNYTLSKQQGDTFSSQSEYNGFYTPLQDVTNLSQGAHSLTGYDQTHVVKGFVTYELPFGKGKKWGTSSSGFVNALIGGWSVNGLVLYASGQPFSISINQPYYPLYSTFYPNYSVTGAKGPFGLSGYQAVGTGGNPPPPTFLYAANVATSPIPADTSTAAVTLGSGPGLTGSLRCPGISNENASVLKYFSMGPDGRYQLSLRVEFYNLFNRHQYQINGCGGIKTQLGSSTFGQVIGVNDNPRNGQFGVRFTF